MVGDVRVPESDEDAEALVDELREKATIFQMDKLSPEDQVRMWEAEPGLVAGVSHLIPLFCSEYVLDAYRLANLLLLV
jgi:hypothetical protein